MRQTIDGAAFKQMIISAAASIELHKQQVNELNVFPVPDGDTGTNMSLTMGTAAADMRKTPDDVSLGQAAKLTASALLRGARGNSGVITSLLFRGISKSLKDKTEADGIDLANALSDGVEAAYKAVMKPTEGTILTVSRVSAAHAMDVALENPCAEAVLEETIKAGYLALDETVNQNPVLQKAGVIDAGGKGYLHILEGMLAALRGESLAAPQDASEPEPEAPVVKEKADFAALDEEITFAYDTVYIMRKFQEDVDLDPLREYLCSIGDSLVIGEDDETFKVHVHTNTPGYALNESQKYGVLELAKIENMRTQAAEMAAGTHVHSVDDLEDDDDHDHPHPSPAAPAAPAEPEIAAPEKRYGVVSVCAGEGLALLFRDLGVDGIIEGGQTMNPCTEDILKQINKTPAEVVFVLPNNKNIVMAAQQAVPLTDKQVVVIPTATVPQGVTAMLALDLDADVETNRAAMEEAITRVTTMQITYAARDSDFDGCAIHAGDYMALVGSSLHAVSTDMQELFRSLAAKANEVDAQFVTIFYGCDVTEEKANACAAVFTELCPNAEVTLLSGGQPVYYYMISAESEA